MAKKCEGQSTQPECKSAVSAANTLLADFANGGSTASNVFDPNSYKNAVSQASSYDDENFITTNPYMIFFFEVFCIHFIF